MTKKQLLEKIEVLEYNVRVLTNNNQIQYDNIKKYEKKLERLAEIGRAVEMAITEEHNWVWAETNNDYAYCVTRVTHKEVQGLLKWYRKRGGVSGR